MLAVEIVAAALLITFSASRSAPPAAPTPTTQTVLADGRVVRLVDLGGISDRALLNRALLDRALLDRALLSRVAAEMSIAVSAVERFWGQDWQRDIVVVATGSDGQFVREAHLDPARQWSDIAAVAVADDVDLARGTASGQRIVLAPGAAAISAAALRIVLTHELFHLAARGGTALDAPRWLTEGVADFIARPSAPVPPGAAAATAIPSDAELDVPGPQRSAGYDRAWWFARFVADDYGVDALRSLYRQACGPGHVPLAAAVREALGADMADVQARWVRWLRASTG